MADSEEIVTFLDSAGNEVSNDPRWLARKVLGKDGVDVDAMEAKIAELQAQVDAAKAVNAMEASVATTEPAEPADETDAASDQGDEYDQLNGAALKALAGERGVDISGLTKVGQVRDALRAADASA